MFTHRIDFQWVLTSSQQSIYVGHWLHKLMSSMLFKCFWTKPCCCLQKPKSPLQARSVSIACKSETDHYICPLLPLGKYAPPQNCSATITIQLPLALSLLFRLCVLFVQHMKEPSPFGSPLFPVLFILLYSNTTIWRIHAMWFSFSPYNFLTTLTSAAPS